MGLNFSNENLAPQVTVGGQKIIAIDPIALMISATSTTGQVFYICPPSNISGTTSANANLYQYVISSISVAFTTASASGTFNIEHLTGTTAPGSGNAMLATAGALTGTANTVVNLVPTASDSAAIATINGGDRLALTLGGTLTGLANCNITVSLARV
jgi:hypothetical protein